MRKMENVELSVAIITKNEEGNLPACLESVAFASDIVVVDSGSTDRTVEIAKMAGCRIYVEEWKGFGPQKNSAIEKCLYDWVLVIDADERVPEVTQRRIIDILKNPTADAYSFKRKNYFHGKWLRFGDAWPDRQVRLINRRKGYFRGPIHERWITPGTVIDLPEYIEHFSFKNYSEMLKTLDEYSTITAHELFKQGKNLNTLTPLIHASIMFFRLYLLRFGFLDGFDGFIMALLKALGSFFKYAKLRELYLLKED
jgi:glycosyltransferase involved in cell wall biosynthesis